MYALPTLLTRGSREVSQRRTSSPSGTFLASLLAGSNILLMYSLTNRGKVLVLAKKRLRRLIYKTINVINNFATSELVRRLCREGVCYGGNNPRRVTVIVENRAVYKVSIYTLAEALEMCLDLPSTSVRKYEFLIRTSLCLLKLATRSRAP